MLGQQWKVPAAGSFLYMLYMPGDAKSETLIAHAHAIKVSLFHHDTDRISPVGIDAIANTNVPATPFYSLFKHSQNVSC